MLATARDRRVSDPLTAALLPPPDETAAAREARLANEREAKKVSDSIDEQIRQEKDARKAKLKGRKEIKVLLLGQSESGKSTTLKRKSPPWVPMRLPALFPHLDLVQSFSWLIPPMPSAKSVWHGALLFT
jgi:hypothetical protein